MSSRASGGALAACLITAAIVGFAGGGYFGSQSGGGDTPSASETAAPDDTTPVGETPDGGETPAETETPAGDGTITLSADPTQVAPNGDINFAVTLNPPEEGVELLIQRSVDGSEWEPFPNVSAIETDANGTGTSRVNSQREGVNSFRVVRADDESVVSNEVQVTIG
ncbi:hypothetical protein [Jiangella rhizosphaerae]|uniref:Uncharacterized protein n=1 Tax=Jiangella rhizosphaerae TaxID=2293569 RepID=A0A418KR18_9ACTN|nr:hypothetical protein [Jiangella rhizosphaerae]RIQ22861.1 hypothetical protein DY240_13095 [Jiangella rhizosphaerae]